MKISATSTPYPFSPILKFQTQTELCTSLPGSPDRDPETSQSPPSSQSFPSLDPFSRPSLLSVPLSLKSPNERHQKVVAVVLCLCKVITSVRVET